MGPYYFTALVALMGPAQRVCGSVNRTFARRTVGSGPKVGDSIDVEVPTHAAGTIDFAIGAVATFVMSFDVWHAELPRIEIYGSEGSLGVPNPNTFDGPVRMRSAADAEWQEVPVPLRHEENSRGLGLSEMVDAILHDLPCTRAVRGPGPACPRDHARGARGVQCREILDPALPRGQARAACRGCVDRGRLTDYYYQRNNEEASMRVFQEGQGGRPGRVPGARPRPSAGARSDSSRSPPTSAGRPISRWSCRGFSTDVGDTTWFEDFERDNWLARIMGGRKKFEKTEISFSKPGVRAARLVTRSGAMLVNRGAVPAEKLNAPSAVGRIFSNPIVVVTLSNGMSLFFDMIRRNEFVAQLSLTGSASPPPQ